MSDNPSQDNYVTFQSMKEPVAKSKYNDDVQGSMRLTLGVILEIPDDSRQAS